jgi:uncharacterized protein
VARLRLKVVPKASRAEISGWVGEALKVRVTAPPERGKANVEVIAVIARALDVGREQVSLITGETDARKLVDVAGVTEAELLARIERHLAVTK